MRHETYIDVLKSVFLTVVCLVFFPLLLPAISPSQDPNGVPENLLIFGEEEEEQSASIHHVDSLSDASSDDPDWYVEPIIPDSLKAPFGAPRSSVRGFGEEEAERSASISRADSRSGVSADDRAPMRASAAGCLTDSILTFNQDSVLTEATTYDYDAAGRTIRTTVWQYNADGSRTGKSKQEYAFDANGTQIYTGTFAWDAATNDWKGTAKSEYVYNEAHQMESNITYTWVNNSWLPSQALTYAYDAAGRETEYTTYTRNNTVNHLVPSKQRLQTWYNSSKKTLEINYTAYSNGAWSAGNKKEYDYDAKGNQIEYTYYASYSGGNWVGSTHELWTYNASNKKTYYKKETWSNNAWAVSNEEFTGYDAAGNTILVENYTLSSSVWKGSKKEEYTYNSSKKKLTTIKYKWSNGTFVYNTKIVNNYDAAGNTTETANYSWSDNRWNGSGTRTLSTYNGSKKVTEQIKQTWSSADTAWVNSERSTTTYAGSNITQEAAYLWSDNDWVGSTRKDYYYDASNRNDTSMTYTNNGIDWVYSARTVNLFDARGNNTLTRNDTWNGAAWVLKTASRLDVAYDDGGRKILNATYQAGADSVWNRKQKQEWEFDTSGHELLNITYNGSSTNWVYSTKSQAQYNAAGQLTKSERFTWSNNQWVGNQCVEYEYDEAGRQTVYAVYLQWNATKQSWIGLSWTGTVYDANGTQIGTVSANWTNEGWMLTYRYTHVYDAAGHEIESLTEKYDTAQTTWINAIKKVSVYDGNTLVQKDDYKWVDSNWYRTLHQENNYDAADHKLRSTINATWNESGLLTYEGKRYFYSCDAPTNNNGAQPRTPTELEEIDENFDTNVQPFDPMRPAYNLQGQSVDPATYHGIVIQNGKKYVL